jgi:multiple sugar transport system substrate-binding protein
MSQKKRFNRREFLSLVSAAAGATVLAACAPVTQPESVPAETQAETKAEVEAPPAGEVVEIVYWHGWSGRFADWLDRVAEGFEEENSDINVEFVQIDWDELYPKLLTAVAAGTPPDTYVAGNESGQLYSLAANGVIIPIEETADPDDLAQLKEIVHPSILEIGTYEGKLWAIPQWTQSYALLVNTDYLAEAGIDPDQPPETLDELDAIAEKLFVRDDDGTIRRIGFDPGNWYFNYWGRFNGQYVDDNGEPTAIHLNNVNCVKWMAGYSEKYDPTMIAQFREAVSGSDATQPFLTGMFAISQEGPWRLGDIYEYKQDMSYKVWRIPRPASVEGYGMSTGGDIPVIPVGVKDPQASFRWARYLIGVDNPEVYATLWTVGLRPHMPISETVARGPAFDKVYEMFPGFDVYVDDFFGGDWWAPPAKLPVAEFYSDRLNSNVERARLLQVTPEEALETTQKEVVDELDKWRAAHG